MLPNSTALCTYISKASSLSKLSFLALYRLICFWQHLDHRRYHTIPRIFLLLHEGAGPAGSHCAPPHSPTAVKGVSVSQDHRELLPHGTAYINHYSAADFSLAAALTKDQHSCSETCLQQGRGTCEKSQHNWDFMSLFRYF